MKRKFWHRKTPIVFDNFAAAREAGRWVEWIGRPGDGSPFSWVTCEGFSPPVYLISEDQDRCVLGCGEAHEPDDDNGLPMPCSFVLCHGRQGDDRR